MNEHPLRQWRKKNNIILADFAERVQSTASSISRIERGVQSPSLALLVRIIDATNQDVTMFHFFMEWMRNDSP